MTAAEAADVLWDHTQATHGTGCFEAQVIIYVRAQNAERDVEVRGKLCAPCRAMKAHIARCAGAQPGSA